jgi:hypothetical protein
VGLGRPRARRRLARGGVRPSSEAETSPRGTGADLGPWALLSPGLQLSRACFGVCRYVRLCFIFLRKGSSPRLLGDPYVCPRQRAE